MRHVRVRVRVSCACAVCVRRVRARCPAHAEEVGVVVPARLVEQEEVPETGACNAVRGGARCARRTKLNLKHNLRKVRKAHKERKACLSTHKHGMQNL